MGYDNPLQNEYEGAVSEYQKLRRHLHEPLKAPTTSPQGEHSPLPWRAYLSAGGDSDGSNWFVAQDHGEVHAYGSSVTGWGCVQQSKADAELIVRAVNNHEALVAALTNLVAADNCNYDRDAMRHEGYFDAARKALKDAGVDLYQKGERVARRGEGE